VSASPLAGVSARQDSRSDTRAKGRRRSIPSGLLGLLLVLPATILTMVVMVVPLAVTLLASFNGPRADRIQFPSLGAFVFALQTPGLEQAVVNGLTWAVIAVVVAPTVALVSAGLVEDGPVPGKAFIRFLFFCPYILSLAVAGVIFGRFYDPTYGLFNLSLRAVGLPSNTQWLGDPQLALGAAVVVFLWHETPFCFLVFSSAVRQLDRELYEAARLDGAGGLRIFVSITTPQLRRIWAVLAGVMFITGMVAFPVIFALTAPAVGAPSHSTEILPTLIYTQGIQGGNAPTAAALSVLLLALFAVILGGIALARKLFSRA
jgi:raffinose/stachyose/melibiose transport system permease protein